MSRKDSAIVSMLLAAALVAAGTPAAAGGFDGMPLMQFGDTVYEPLYPCSLVVLPAYRHITLYCDGPEGDGVGVLQHPGQRIPGAAVATGWRVEALLPIHVYGSQGFEAEGCEIVEQNHLRCDGFSDGFEP